MMVIQQTVIETVAAVVLNRYNFAITSGQNTYRLAEFTAGFAGASSTALTAAEAERIRLILLEDSAIPSGVNRLVLSGGGGAQSLAGAQAAGAVNFNGDGSFSLTGVNLTNRTQAQIDFTIPEHMIPEHVMYPADRCTWTQEDSRDGRGYTIEDATFYPGHAAGIALGTISGAGMSVQDVELGFIGKSGRFVAITDSN